MKIQFWYKALDFQSKLMKKIAAQRNSVSIEIQNILT